MHAVNGLGVQCLKREIKFENLNKLRTVMEMTKLSTIISIFIASA